ncbi:hypothetical protein BGY98DRAFT_1188644 [Russula aff. rugulosa BPL654]|nr:hypothetical protein BGY98DRAFT_1188644 [Russula aff. rugulosa BPL654]
MSDKMRWYMIPFWIFLTLSVSHFALAAPVAVGETVEVRSNPAEVLNDAMTGREKRMDPNDKDQPSTNDVHLPDGVPRPGDAPGVVQEGVDAEGVKEEGVSGSGWDPNKFPELPSNLEELLWPIKEPDAEGVKEEGVSGWEWDPKKFPEVPSNLEELLRGINGPYTASHNNPPEEESDGGGGGGGDHAMESSQGSAENISPGPQPEHPATPDFITSLKEWLFKTHRRRTQGLQAS